ncbi:MAG: hypothetical protein H7070_11875 [Saprospiraceae bacterium]|nr:hypothetical protein [Pyrinomonadaceae bacterium]
MNGKCIDIGTMQAFLDGETAQALSQQIITHVAMCQNCAVMLADAEEQSSVVFSALDREFNSLVPTQRLWSKINESIAVEKSRTPFWEKLRVSLGVFIANRSIAVAASVLIVFSVFAAIWTMSDTPTGLENSIASGGPVLTSVQQRQDETVTIATTESDSVLPSAENSFQVEAASRTARVRTIATNADFNENRARPRVTNLVYREPSADAEYLPGEESYVKTIAGLKQNVDGEKDSVLPPSSRVAYERDMAVVENAITRMKAVVKKNPKNQSAKQVLYSSYQDKIDLLNSVAQREELMSVR